MISIFLILHKPYLVSTTSPTRRAAVEIKAAVSDNTLSVTSKSQIPLDLKIIAYNDQGGNNTKPRFNEEKIVNRFKFDVPCNDVKMSIGLERHGSSKKKHALSVIDYDKFIVNKTNL